MEAEGDAIIRLVVEACNAAQEGDLSTCLTLAQELGRVVRVPPLSPLCHWLRHGDDDTDEREDEDTDDEYEHDGATSDNVRGAAFLKHRFRSQLWTDVFRNAVSRALAALLRKLESSITVSRGAPPRCFDCSENPCNALRDARCAVCSRRERGSALTLAEAHALLLACILRAASVLYAVGVHAAARGVSAANVERNTESATARCCSAEAEAAVLQVCRYAGFLASMHAALLPSTAEAIVDITTTGAAAMRTYTAMLAPTVGVPLRHCTAHCTSPGSKPTCSELEEASHQLSACVLSGCPPMHQHAGSTMLCAVADVHQRTEVSCGAIADGVASAFATLTVTQAWVSAVRAAGSQRHTRVRGGAGVADAPHRARSCGSAPDTQSPTPAPSASETVMTLLPPAPAVAFVTGGVSARAAIALGLEVSDSVAKLIADAMYVAAVRRALRQTTEHLANVDTIGPATSIASILLSLFDFPTPAAVSVNNSGTKQTPTLGVQEMAAATLVRRLFYRIIRNGDNDTDNTQSAAGVTGTDTPNVTFDAFASVVPSQITTLSASPFLVAHAFGAVVFCALLCRDAGTQQLQQQHAHEVVTIATAVGSLLRRGAAQMPRFSAPLRLATLRAMHFVVRAATAVGAGTRTCVCGSDAVAATVPQVNSAPPMTRIEVAGDAMSCAPTADVVGGNDHCALPDSLYVAQITSCATATLCRGMEDLNSHPDDECAAADILGAAVDLLIQYCGRHEHGTKRKIESVIDDAITALANSAVSGLSRLRGNIGPPHTEKHVSTHAQRDSGDSQADADGCARVTLRVLHTVTVALKGCATHGRAAFGSYDAVERLAAALRAATRSSQRDAVQVATTEYEDDEAIDASITHALAALQISRH